MRVEAVRQALFSSADKLADGGSAKMLGNGLLRAARALAVAPAANAVLQKPLGLITARTYRVTGPWDDPKVEVISREQGRAAPAAAKPAG